MIKVGCLLFATAGLLLPAVVPAEAEAGSRSRNPGVFQHRVNQTRVQHAPVHRAPVHRARVLHAPVHRAPVLHAPVHRARVHHARPIVAHRIHHGHFGHKHFGHRHFHGHSHVGVRFFFGPVWPSVYPVYTAPVVIQQSPPVYIQQGVTAEPYYWYYCASAGAYYPYVQQCAEGWMKVVPPATDPSP